MPHLSPEYPSLNPIELQENADIRLRRSRRRLEGDNRIPTELRIVEPWIREIVGEPGNFDHGTTSCIDEWLRTWRMPPSLDLPDVGSSLAIYVGLVELNEMPGTDGVGAGAPYVHLTTEFVRYCSRLTDLFPHFARTVAGTPTLEQMAAERGLFDSYLGPDAGSNPDLRKALHDRRDTLFSTRTTAAAIRWAIAHEMAHAVGGREQRIAAYRDQVPDFYPDLEQTQWQPKSHLLDNYGKSVKNYRDEIACDLLAIDYVLASPFSVDDLITQVSGSLLALIALEWDGFFKDGSAVSESHPSPFLRFEIVFMAWLKKLTDSKTWDGRELPGMYGVEDVAHWFSFERWAKGAYEEQREGAVWDRDLRYIKEILLAEIPKMGQEQLYARRDNVNFRLIGDADGGGFT